MRYRPLLAIVVCALSIGCGEEKHPTGPDTQAPESPTSFAASAGDASVDLSWVNPTASDFEGVVVARKTNAAPASRGDGTVVYTGHGTFFVDAPLTNGTTYHYAAFAYDKAGNYSTASDAEATPTATSPNGPFRLYMSPLGSDSYDGLSPANALLTLSAVQAKLRQYKPTLDADVEVRIRYVLGAPYRGQTVAWTHTSPLHTVSFMPADYAYGGGVNDIAGRPVLDGQGLPSYCFDLKTRDGTKTNIRLYYLRFERYLYGGIRFHGSSTDRGRWNGYNTVYGCYFSALGNLGYPGGTPFGYAGIDFVNSDYNVIRNNHFVHLENRGPDASHIHGVYIAHASENNLVTANDFTYISGDPVRVRDFSNYNRIVGNTFARTGVFACYSDYHCAAKDECRSWENQFRDNTLGCNYGGGFLPLFTYFDDPCDRRYYSAECCGWEPAGCAALSRRLSTSGNVRNACQ